MRMLACSLVGVGALSAGVSASVVRDVDLNNPSVTQGQAAFRLTPPGTAAVFPFINPGVGEIGGTLALNLVSSTDWDPALDRITLSVFDSQSNALNGVGSIYSDLLPMTVGPDAISSGNGESQNYPGMFGFLLPQLSSSTLYARLSLSSGRLALANTADPLGVENYEVLNGVPFSMSDLGQSGHCWAVRMETVPAPGAAGVLLGTVGLVARRRRR